MFFLQKTVTDDGTRRECASGLSSISCIPTDSTHVCMGDLCNASSRLHPSQLLAAAILVLAVAVVRFIR